MLRLFIDRPILSSVISIVIVIAGIVALRVLPIEQYPDVVPPRLWFPPHTRAQAPR